MQFFSQRDPRYSTKELGWGPPGATIGLYGCDETCDSMIAWDCDFHYNPAQLDDLYNELKIFVPCSSADNDHDCLPVNSLDRAFPGRFRTTTFWGWNAALVSTTVKAPNRYAKAWISYGAVKTHFVIMASADGKYIIDPWTGKIGTLAGYGGPVAVKKIDVIEYIPPKVVVVAPAPKPAPTPATPPAPVVTPPTSPPAPVNPPLVSPAPIPVETTHPVPTPLHTDPPKLTFWQALEVIWKQLTGIKL